MAHDDPDPNALAPEGLLALIEDLRERMRRAERLSLVGRVAAGVAHELRNPLSVIETSVYLLRGVASGDPAMERQLGRISEQVDIASAIVGELLDAARERPLEVTRVDLARTVREAAAWTSRPPDGDLSVALPEGPTVVRGDERRLRQLLINLLSNAYEVMVGQWGPPRVEVALANDSDAVVVAVRDHGPGIAEGDLGRLFEPLFSTRPGGVGMGLALSREIAEAHGGSLTAENAVGGGARFVLRLPLDATGGGRSP